MKAAQLSSEVTALLRCKLVSWCYSVQKQLIAGLAALLIVQYGLCLSLLAKGYREQHLKRLSWCTEAFSKHIYVGSELKESFYHSCPPCPTLEDADVCLRTNQSEGEGTGFSLT